MTWHAMGPPDDEELEYLKRYAAAQQRQWDYMKWREGLPWFIRIFTSKWASK